MATKRRRIKSQRAKESDDLQSSAAEEKCQLWCTVQLTRNNGKVEEHNVRSTFLETEFGVKVTLKDLFYGNNVIWKAKGKPYEVIVLETHRNKPEKKPMLLIESDSELDEIKPDKKDKSRSCTTTNSDNEDEPLEGNIGYEGKNKISGMTSESKPVRYTEDEKKDIGRSSTTSDDEGSIVNEEKRITGKRRPLEDNHGDDVHRYNGPRLEDVAMGSEFIADEVAKIKGPERESVQEDITFLPFTSPFSNERSSDMDQMIRLERKVDLILRYMKHGKHSTKVEVASEMERRSKFTTDKGIYLLDIAATDPGKYALQLMDALFTVEEMASHCFEKTKLSRKEHLDREKVSLLYDCIIKKFGQDKFLANQATIVRKCNQKCLDKYHKVKS